MKIAALILVCVAAGCAANDEPKVCLMKFIGQTESGVSVVAQSCMTPEAFAESQK